MPLCFFDFPVHARPRLPPLPARSPPRRNFAAAESHPACRHRVARPGQALPRGHHFISSAARVNGRLDPVPRTPSVALCRAGPAFASGGRCHVRADGHAREHGVCCGHGCDAAAARSGRCSGAGDGGSCRGVLRHPASLDRRVHGRGCRPRGGSGWGRGQRGRWDAASEGRGAARRAGRLDAAAAQRGGVRRLQGLDVVLRVSCRVPVGSGRVAVSGRPGGGRRR